MVALAGFESACPIQASAAESAVAAVILLAALVASSAGFAFAAIADSALAHLRLDAMVGALGGLVGGLSSAAGLIVTVASLGWVAPAQADAVSGAAFVPFALLGAVGGFALFRRLSTRQFQTAVSLLLVVSGAGLLEQAC